MPLRCFRRRYWKYCTKGMRTVLYNMLGCESFISRSFRPFPRGGEQKTMIVLSFLNSGCERSGGQVRETGRKRLSYRPTIFAKKLQKSREIINFTAFCGGPNRDRTDDLTDANRTLSRGGKFSAHGLRHVGRLYNVRMDYNFLAKTRSANDALKVLHISFIELCLECVVLFFKSFRRYGTSLRKHMNQSRQY